jgi:hypothetical protein
LRPSRERLINRAMNGDNGAVVEDRTIHNVIIFAE